MDFRTALVKANEYIAYPQSELASQMEVGLERISFSLKDKSDPNYKPPPQGWREHLARVVDEKANEVLSKEEADEFHPERAEQLYQLAEKIRQGVE